MAKIVIIDDCRGVITYMKSALEKQGHTIFTFHDPLESIKITPLLCPDIVICDYIMLDMVGIDVITNLKEAGVKSKYILFSSLHDPILISLCETKNILYYNKENEREKLIEDMRNVNKFI